MINTAVFRKGWERLKKNIEPARKIIYVEWIDAESQDSWESEEVVKGWAKRGGAVIRQVGFLVAEEKDYLLICCQYDSVNKSYGHANRIPAPWIIKKECIWED